MEEVETQNKLDGVVIGVVISCSRSGVPMVAFSENLTNSPVEAKTTIALNSGHIGREVALLFEGGDVRKPLIIGLMHNPVEADENDERQDAAEIGGVWSPSEPATDLVVDGESMRVSAKREIVLKCGKASITLTSSGKVIVRGKYISTRSSGVNRIKGGSVQIN